MKFALNWPTYKLVTYEFKFNFKWHFSCVEVHFQAWHLCWKIFTIFIEKIWSSMMVCWLKNNDFWSFLCYKQLFTDPRMNNFLMRTPWTVFSIIVIYLYFVNNFGKKWMRNREPFELKTIINVYNLLQVVLNFSMVIIVSCTRTKFSFVNQSLKISL